MSRREGSHEAMPEQVRHLVESLTKGRPSRVVLELLLYAIGAGIFFYLVDVLLMRWQGLALH